ncbi:MAG: SDR family oxidoreductase [Ilumatobacteraceae bacterium]
MSETYPFTCGLITGASSGIGEEFVHILGESHIPLVVVARRRDRLEALAARYSNVEILVADLSTDAGVELIEHRITDESKMPIDLVINNAGFGSSGLVSDLDIDRLSCEIRLNVLALTRISHAAVRVMLGRGRGFLLNVSSVASFQASPGLAVYAATKAYVTSFTEALHEELRGTEVRVTALCPGLTHTEFQRVSNTTGLESKFPEFAWLQPREVAEVGLDAVAKGEALAIPGALYKGLSALSSALPRGATRRLSGFLANMRK